MKTKALTHTHKLTWGLIGLALFSYGLLSFNAGSKVSPALTPLENPAEVVTYINQQAESGVDMSNSDAVQVLPSWLNLMAKVSSSDYAYGDDGILKTEHYYFSMGDTKRYVLSAHMMLGMVIMVTGFFQFFPAFRRKHRRAHRVLGAIYIAAAIGSMSMSTYYLINTPVADTFNEFVFHYGLWFVLLLSMISIGFATVAIFKRNVAVHLGWQALAFGCFLTAPIQRYIWVALAPLGGDRTFNEMNILINITLFAVCFFCSYLLFYVNRESSPARPAKASEQVGSNTIGQYLLAGGLGFAWLLTLWFYVVSPGLAGSDFTQHLSNPSIASHHDQIFATFLPVVFVALLAVFFFACYQIMSRAHGKLGHFRSAQISGTGIAILLIYWGVTLGMPDHTVSLAGTFYAAVGAFMLAFLTWMSLSFRQANLDHARELMWFLIMLAVAPAAMYLNMFNFDSIGFVPEPYATSGHGYQYAAAAALANAMIIGHLAAVYSKHTKQYAVN